MNLSLQSQFTIHNSQLKITGSKSETNRLLLLQALYPNITLENTSDSDDSRIMADALNNNNSIIDIHHAGTAMRFLTAYFANQENREITLTGSPRMKERPVRILVDALQQLGAKIEYLEKEGFPPLKIKGTKITKKEVTLNANVSSQYISALLLMAPKFENGLVLKLEGAITSLPYIKMTLALLNKIGVESLFQNNIITIYPKLTIPNTQFTIESDWTSASYYYSIVALSKIGTEIRLSNYRENSLQGDHVLSTIYEDFGITTLFKNNSIVIKKMAYKLKTIRINLNATPDLAQTIAVTCFGLGVGCALTGLKTLNIKETNRLEALKTELSQLGATVITTNESLTLAPSTRINSNKIIKTYDDHRMAMAFATLATKTNIKITNTEVVSKSYPDFWKDLQSIGFNISEF